MHCCSKKKLKLPSSAMILLCTKTRPHRTARGTKVFSRVDTIVLRLLLTVTGETPNLLERDRMSANVLIHSPSLYALIVMVVITL